jgi:hypothetical protein
LGKVVANFDKLKGAPQGLSSRDASDLRIPAKLTGMRINFSRFAQKRRYLTAGAKICH